MNFSSYVILPNFINVHDFLCELWGSPEINLWLADLRHKLNCRLDILSWVDWWSFWGFCENCPWILRLKVRVVYLKEHIVPLPKRGCKTKHRILNHEMCFLKLARICTLVSDWCSINFFCCRIASEILVIIFGISFMNRAWWMCLVVRDKRSGAHHYGLRSVANSRLHFGGSSGNKTSLSSIYFDNLRHLLLKTRVDPKLSFSFELWIRLCLVLSHWRSLPLVRWPLGRLNLDLLLNLEVHHLK